MEEALNKLTRNQFMALMAAMAIGIALVLPRLLEWATIHPEYAGWAQAVGTVLAVLGAVGIERWRRDDSRAYDQTIARMEIAAYLRSWSRETALLVATALRTVQSEIEPTSSFVPPTFRFADNPALVAKTGPAYAKKLFSILEQHARVSDNIRATCEMDVELAQSIFFNDVVTLFDRVRIEYVTLAARCGLHPYVNQTWELDAIKSAAKFHHK